MQCLLGMGTITVTVSTLATHSIHHVIFTELDEDFPQIIIFAIKDGVYALNIHYLTYM
jgi:bifunctional DNase/RNase